MSFLTTAAAMQAEILRHYNQICSTLLAGRRAPRRREKKHSQECILKTGSVCGLETRQTRRSYQSVNISRTM